MPVNLLRRRSFFDKGVQTGALLILLTGVVIVVQLSAALRAYHSQQQESHRKAERIAEFGLQNALQKMIDSGAGACDCTACDGGWVIAKSLRTKYPDSMGTTLVSEGHMGSVVEGRMCRLVKVPARAGSPPWIIAGGIRVAGPDDLLRP
jgi:hypothetical protein